jgi:hypothetical protein
MLTSPRAPPDAAASGAAAPRDAAPAPPGAAPPLRTPPKSWQRTPFLTSSRRQMEGATEAARRA